MALSSSMAQSSSILKVMNETSFDQSWAVIGAGKFGKVWKTKHLQWGFNVAVKILGRDNGLLSNEDLEKEAEFMLRAAEGPYSMRVIGVFRGDVPAIGNTMVGLVMEMMERGSLASLQGKLKHLPPWPLVFRLAHQVALGMNYLHSLEPALIHKDLKPGNLLLDSGLNVKITDFGLTKFVNSATASCITNFGTVPFIPPEALQGGATYAYDVYSYAMVLYSILHTGHGSPVFDNSTEERPSLEYVKGMTASGLEELVDLMVKCWNQSPDQRPTFKECIAVTERLYEKHKKEICHAVHKVRQELDSVPLENKMAEMMVELQLLKDKIAVLERDNAGGSTGSSFLHSLPPQPDDELSRIQQYEVDVTLDPDTANYTLILSEDGKQVSLNGDKRKNLPDNTKRFLKACVLGKQGFSSGKFYYEVQVGGKTSWRLGVAREFIDRKGLIKMTPNTGYWSVLSNVNTQHSTQEYKATADPDVLFSVKGKLQKVGVFVDYEKGLVSFYDVKARVHLYSFTGCSFTEKLFPLFSPGVNDGVRNSAPLIIHTPVLDF